MSVLHANKHNLHFSVSSWRPVKRTGGYQLLPFFSWHKTTRITDRKADSFLIFCYTTSYMTSTSFARHMPMNMKWKRIGHRGSVIYPFLVSQKLALGKGMDHCSNFVWKVVFVRKEIKSEKWHHVELSRKFMNLIPCSKDIARKRRQETRLLNLHDMQASCSSPVTFLVWQEHMLDSHIKG